MMKNNNFKNSIMESFFYKNPELETISWTQYTSFFSDDGFKMDMNSIEVNPVFMSDKVRVFLSSIEDAFYLSKFGSNSKITVDRHGITVEEYEHLE